MLYQLRYGALPIGTVELDDSTPAAGYLDALPAYEPLLPTIQAAGDALIRTAFRETPRITAALRAAAELVAQLELASESGTSIATSKIDLWDDSKYPEPPFVLVYFDELPVRVAARLRPPVPKGSSEK